MYDRSPNVKGLSLNDYFRLEKDDLLESSGDIDCLIGELVTKPRGFNQIEEIKIDEKEEDAYTQTQDPNITEQYDDIKPQKQLNNYSTKNSPPDKDRKLSKLSSVELRSSSIRFYKSNKMRIRQVSNSPYQRQLSKPKETFKTLNGSNMFSTQHPLMFCAPKSSYIQQYYRNALSPVPKQEQKLINIRQIKQLKQLERHDDFKNKNKLECLYNTVNSYPKKLRDLPKSKYHHL